MQAPVLTPEKRASVKSATCTSDKCFKAKVRLSHLFHSGAHRPTVIQDDYAALGLIDRSLRPLAPAWLPFPNEILGRARHLQPPFLSTTEGSIEVLFTTEPSRAKFRREQTVLVKPFSFAVDKSHDDVVRVHLVLLGQYLPKAVAAGRTFPILEVPAQGISRASHGIEDKQVEIP